MPVITARSFETLECRRFWDGCPLVEAAIASPAPNCHSIFVEVSRWRATTGKARQHGVTGSRFRNRNGAENTIGVKVPLCGAESHVVVAVGICDLFVVVRPEQVCGSRREARVAQARPKPRRPGRDVRRRLQPPNRRRSRRRNVRGGWRTRSSRARRESMRRQSCGWGCRCAARSASARPRRAFDDLGREPRDGAGAKRPVGGP